MRKKWKFIALCVVLLGLAGSFLLTQTDSRFEIFPITTPRQKQLKYLKEHEQDIIDFVKAQNPKIESVQIDWETMNIGEIGAPAINGYMLSIQGRFNGIKDTNFIVDFPLEEKDEIPNIEKIFIMNPLRILKNGGWDIYE